jgi:hypothetical protein
MVEAQGDPAIVTPRLKLGHDDPRFNGAILDGEPAFGTAQNLRLVNNGQTVIADYVGVPSWLAAILPSAYPNRSVEGNWDVETVTGHKYRFVCTDVALLGVVWPGISTLDDLQAAFSENGPEGVTVAKTKVIASVNLEDVQRSFYDDFATQDNGRYWWWVRAVLLDPNELVADDDEGGLYRVPFATSGDSVSFQDPIPVKIEYVDTPAEEPVAAKMGSHSTVVAATYANSRSSRPASRQEGEVATTASVDLGALRRYFGLAEDATEDQINAAIAAQEEEGEEGTDEEGTEEEEEETTEETEEEETAPSAIAASTVRVDKATLSQLQADAALGRQAYEKQRIEGRDAFLLAAINTGKFPPARLQHWKDAWENDPEGIKAAIDQMPEGLIPVGEQLGVAPSETGGTQPAYPAHWLPEVQRNRSGTISQEA